MLCFQVRKPLTYAAKIVSAQVREAISPAEFNKPRRKSEFLELTLAPITYSEHLAERGLGQVRVSAPVGSSAADGLFANLAQVLDIPPSPELFEEIFLKDQLADYQLQAEHKLMETQLGTKVTLSAIN